MPERQHLIFDADDTLWENNVYFERAFDEFAEFLGHSTLTPAGVRSVLDEIELVNREIHGYGALNFGRNLRQCYQRLAEREPSADDLARVMSFAERILEQPLELIEGVWETLEYLAPRHELILFTKGHPEEQTYKIEVSGLAPHFRYTAIVKENDAGSFRALVGDWAWRRSAPGWSVTRRVPTSIPRSKSAWGRCTFRMRGPGPSRRRRSETTAGAC